jgi:hypothetical protein
MSNGRASGAKFAKTGAFRGCTAKRGGNRDGVATDIGDMPRKPAFTVGRSWGAFTVGALRTIQATPSPGESAAFTGRLTADGEGS